MFSFFRKKGPDGQEVLTQTAPMTQTGVGVNTRPRNPETISPPVAPPEAPKPAATEGHYDLSQLSIEVSSSSDSLSAAEEQAAMLHANGQLAAAVKVLQQDKPNFAGKRRQESWLMLFELLQQYNQREAFEALGLEYVVEFEKTPPTWQAQQAVEKHKPAASAYFALSGKLSHDSIDKQIQAFYQLHQNNDQLRMDLSKVTEIDTISAAELLAALQQSHKKPNSIQLIGSHIVLEILRRHIEVGRRHPAEAPFWLLLIELHQVLGLQDEFENLAVDYAITFEVSPPSWDARQAPKSVEQIARAEAQAQAELKAAEQDKNTLSGAITTAHPEQLAQLAKLVEKSLAPVIDLRHIQRIDFDSAGQMLNLAMQWLQEGRQVRFINVNPLVSTLLRVMSISEMISVELRK
ncbi:STAS domain-containing protein [Chitinibacter fontanus]|uniref:STAS domain-containing protein n=1 Tax=Chitinibacter fontanus TaxID=1737446 RepID=A0A7D5V8E0_9NEIS|nr:STAS domain-containing protein [Chitinibacter fontanus]QLI80655.1 STAS domain-containing protein [Chitinibacter fontanus]